MRRIAHDRQDLFLMAGLFGMAVVYALVLVQPITSASIGRDAAGPVIHFERIVAGRHLETYLGITPKPLITFINGGLYTVTHDWRPVVWATIGAFALSVVLGAALARRVAGPAAAAFVAVGLLVSPALLSELAFAHAVPWALLTWIVAALAATAERPRYAVAGLALAVGTTARVETLLVVVLATAVLVSREVWSRRRHRPPPPRAAYLIMLGFLALPVMLAHDWLLSGDPFLWAKVAQINSEITTDPVRSPLWVTAWLMKHLLSEAPLLPLAALGGLLIVRERLWALAIGLLALGPGVGVFLVYLAARHVFFSERYAEAIDLALLVAAGIGLTALDLPSVRGLLDRFAHDARRAAAVPLAAGVVAATAFAPIGPLDTTLYETAAHEIQLLRDEQRAVAVIRVALVGVPTWRDGNGQLPGGKPRVLVPARVREQLVVDLDLSLTTVVRTTASGIDLSRGRLVAGQIVYHDRLDDRVDKRYAALEIDQPTTIGSVRLVPLLADRGLGMWILRVDAAPP